MLALLTLAAGATVALAAPKEGHAQIMVPPGFEPPPYPELEWPPPSSVTGTTGPSPEPWLSIFRFFPKTSMPVRLAVCGGPSDYTDIDLSVYRQVGSQREYVTPAGSRCGPGLTGKKIIFRPVAGGEYWISPTARGEAHGDFTITLERAHPPANDLPAGAHVFSGPPPHAFRGTTRDATAWEPYGGDGDIWWTWVPPRDIVVSMNATRDDTYVKLWRGPTPASMIREKLGYMRYHTKAALQGGERYWFQVQSWRHETVSFELDRFEEGGTAVGPARRVLSSGAGKARVKTIPIASRAGARPVSVRSVPIGRLDRLSQSLKGRRIAAAGELQVTVCLRPGGGRHRGDCSGRMYGYDPKVRAHLAISDRPGGARGEGTRRLTKTRSLRCTQSQPNRNHHCVLSIPWTAKALRKLRCLPVRCRVNLVASAHHPRASGGERVIVGGITHGGKIRTRGKATVSVAQEIGKAKTLADRQPASRRLPLSRVGRSPKKRVVHSVAIRPKEGHALVVDGRYAASLAGLPYNARIRTAVVLADRPRATRPGKRAGQVSIGSARLSGETNFNCTKGSSGHRSPCAIRKSGVVRFSKGSRKPVYVNLVAGHGAIGGAASHRWRGTHRVKVGKGGYLKVRRLTR